MRRLLWVAVGVGLGGIVGISLTRWARRTRQRYSPANIAAEAGTRASDFAERFRDAVEAGRAEMQRREAELRAELGLPPA